MSATCTALGQELISSYVDRELGQSEIAEVEAHLEDCHFCRGQLNRVAGVANSLRSLDRVAPPPILDELVLGQLEVRGARTWSERLDSLLTPSGRVKASIGPVFAMVMMLVMLVFLFSDALVRRASQPVVISVPAIDLSASGGLRPSIVTSNGRQWIEVTGAEWAEFARVRGASRVVVELEAAQQAGLNQGPGAGAALLLMGVLPPCGQLTASERAEFAGLAGIEDPADLERLMAAANDFALVVVTEANGDHGCRLLPLRGVTP